MAGLNNEVLFYDGEGLFHQDFNNMQRFNRTFVNDGIWSSYARLTESDHSGPSTAHAYAIGNGGAIYADGTAFTNCAGVIVQRIDAAAPDGSSPKSLMYFVSEGEFSEEMPQAAAGNHRWDIITTQLVELGANPLNRDFKDAVSGAVTSTAFDKFLQATPTTDGSTPGFLRTQGTEVLLAATPVEPATPAGHIKIAAVLVDDVANAVDPYTELRDYRVPVGCTVEGWQGGSDWATGPNWTSGTSAIMATNAAAVASRNSHGGGYRRLLDFRMGATVQANPMTVELRRFDGFTTSAVIANLSSGFPVSTTTWGTFGLDAGQSFPIWANGYMAGIAAEIAGPNGANGSHEFLGVRIVSGANNATAYSGQWVFAGL